MLKTRARQLARALAGRCPLCGARWPRRGHRLAPQCPTCQVRLARNEHDAFLGAYTLNLFATLLTAVLVAVANVRWNHLPALPRVLASGVVIAGVAWVFHPWSKLLWLFLDAQFRPPVERDFEDDTG